MRLKQQLELSDVDWESDEEELELDKVDEEYIDEEPIYTFYFHSYHKRVRIDQYVSYISVGRFTGKVRYFHLDVPSDERYFSTAIHYASHFRTRGKRNLSKMCTDGAYVCPGIR